MNDNTEKIEAPSRTADQWEMDNKAYFLIKIEEDRIEVRAMELQAPHYEGEFVSEQKPIKDYVGKDPTDLYYKIINDGMVSNLQHAAYLGAELYKAYVAIKLNKKYVQDSDLL